MKILGLKQLFREETGLYYRRNFTCLAVIEIPIKTLETPVDFIIETGPMGNKDIAIYFKEKLEYPLLPVLKAIKELVLSLDKEGKLP